MIRKIVFVLTGSNGGGKGFFADTLVSLYGALHLSSREFLARELPPDVVVDGTALNTLSRRLSEDRGPAFIIDAMAEAMFAGDHAIVVAESVRRPAEIRRAYELAGPDTVVIPVSCDAPLAERIRRMRELRQSSTDFEDIYGLILRNNREIYGANNGHAVLACMGLSQIKLRVPHDPDGSLMRRIVKTLVRSIRGEKYPNYGDVFSCLYAAHAPYTNLIPAEKIGALGGVPYLSIPDPIEELDAWTVMVELMRMGVRFDHHDRDGIRRMMGDELVQPVAFLDAPKHWGRGDSLGTLLTRDGDMPIHRDTPFPPGTMIAYDFIV